jgi:hypothetical protein
MSTTTRPAAEHNHQEVLDGRITNGGKGVAYLRDYYLPELLTEQMQSVGSPGS